MILDYMFTYGGPELFVLFTVFIVTPVVYLCGLKSLRWRSRMFAICGLWLAAIAIGFTDVYLIAREARRLCTAEAGVRVYKTVQAEGFLGDSGIEYWANYGFRYVEAEFRGGNKRRYELLDGKRKESEISEIISRYEVKTEFIYTIPHFTKIRTIVSDRHTGGIMGQLILFNIYPGRLDRNTVGGLGFTWTPPMCDGSNPPSASGSHLTQTNLIKAVIIPPLNGLGE
ncbi:MAG: hypothetical protein HYY48_08150 [Gammaproteobacteria bacterium]|nr:hypothetical protein [Gammaproteobacteria bacterium]